MARTINFLMAKKIKNKNPSARLKQNASVTPADNNVVSNSPKNKLYRSLLTGAALVVIFIFSLFLRVEDFATWQQNPQLFKYQNEYQMTNFDSYYYLQFAKDLKRGHYDDVDEKRLTPNGASRPTVPPLLSVLALNISKFSGVSLPAVAVFMPAFLSSLLIFIVFLLGRRLGMNKIAALIAALLSIVSLTYVVRTRIGVFDTDSLNVVFTLLNSYLLLHFALDKTRAYWFLALAFVNTFFYFIWWNNAYSVVMLSAFVPLVIALLFFKQYKNQTTVYYLLAALSLIGFYVLNEEIIFYAQLVFDQQHNVFPVHSVVAELQKVGLGGFIKGTTGSVTIFIMALLGLIYWFKVQKIKLLLLAFPVLMALLPFVAGSRFMIFSAPILALGVGYFVQGLFDNRRKITDVGVYFATTFAVGLGVYANYDAITYKSSQPAVFENKPLLNALKAHTASDATIWTNWDLGNQIHYYLDQNTIADGQFKDGEIFYYLHFPLAANNLALSANFMHFYAQQGVKGMHKLYAIFGSEVETFAFLRQVLSLAPKQAEKIIREKLKYNTSLKNADLTTVKQWLVFLYPKQENPVYLLLHEKMSQTSSWFKQGAMDLNTGKTKGLPFFLAFKNLSDGLKKISSQTIRINKSNGHSQHISGTNHNLAYVLTHDGKKARTKRYANTYNKPLVFEWHKPLGYGALMSKKVANTTFNKLFIRHKKSEYFQAIILNTPHYQIWKVVGDAYEPEK